MGSVMFFIAAIGVIAGAIGMVTLSNPFYSVLALVGHLLSLAVLSYCCAPDSWRRRRWWCMRAR